MEEINEWLIFWFIKNTDANIDEIRNNTHTNYFESGWLNSLKFIEFISDIESTFKIKFSNNEFENKIFSTIDGITKIIESKRNE